MEIDAQISAPKPHNPEHTPIPAELDLQISTLGPQNHRLTPASTDNTCPQKFGTAVPISATEIENKPNTPTFLSVPTDKYSGSRNSRLFIKSLPVENQNLKPQGISSLKKIYTNVRASAVDPENQESSQVPTLGIPGVQNPYTYWRSIREGFTKTPEINTQLVAAASKGDVKRISEILDQDITLHPQGITYWKTAFQAAAGEGRWEAVELLLKAGRKFNNNAAEDGLAEVAVNESALEGPEGRTALQAAAEGGRKEIVRLLLDKGANINAPPAKYKGRTALQAAAEKGHEGIVKLLVDGGADIDAKPSTIGGISAIEAANKGGYKSISAYLNSKRPETPDLHSFCQYGKEVGEEFRKLLDGEASKTIINSRDSAGQTPLHFAAVRPFKDAVVLLLEKGAQTDRTNLDYRNPLDSAIFELLEVRELIASKGMGEKEDLTRADGLLEIILLLLKHGAAPHAHNIDQSLAWRKIFPCPKGKSDEILELKAIPHSEAISK